MPSDRVTLETIARAVGVSKMTVSNAYNRPDQLSGALRERIFDAARQLGYPGPNPLARTLRHGHTGALGLAFDEPLSYVFTDPAIGAILQGMAAECERDGVGLLLVPGAPSPSTALDLLRTALVDAVAIFCDRSADQRIEVLRQRGLPFVMVDAAPQAGLPWVGIDDRGGARLAAQHLLDLGHRRFGVLALWPAPDAGTARMTSRQQRQPGSYVTRQRLAGYRAVLEAAGIDWQTVPVYGYPAGLTSAEGGYHMASHLLDGPEHPSAILAMSDELAFGLLRAARERGIAVPRELSVVGFDDVAGAARSRPPLTTVHQALAEKGVAAARLLLDAERAGARRITLPVHLVVRSSTAPAPR